MRTNAKKKPALPAQSVGDNQFLKAKPLAARLGLHPKTLFRMADAGLIHRHKINARVVLFSVKEALDFVASSRVAGGGKAA